MECSLHVLLVLLIQQSVVTRTKCRVSAEGGAEVPKGGEGKRGFGWSLENLFSLYCTSEYDLLLIFKEHFSPPLLCFHQFHLFSLERYYLYSLLYVVLFCLIL